MNEAAKNGVLTADVTDGLPEGVYRMGSINAAANHQPVIVPVAQHGMLDDIVYFTVKKGAGNGANNGGNTGNQNNGGNNGGNNGANKGGNNGANNGGFGGFGGGGFNNGFGGGFGGFVKTDVRASPLPCDKYTDLVTRSSQERTKHLTASPRSLILP